MYRRALLVAALMILVPMTAIGQASAQDAGGTQGTDTITFYGHVFGNGLGQPMPANTQFPAGEASYGIGSGVHCKSVGPTVPTVTVPFLGGVNDDVEPCTEEEGNKLALFSTAGPVTVKDRAEFQREGGYGQLHNERGQTKDIQLDTSQSIKSTVFLSMDAHGWLVGAGDTNCLHFHPENLPCVYPYWGWDPGVFEGVVVESTLYSADLGSRENSSAAPPVEEAYDSGNVEVVAQGQWGPGQVMNGIPGAPNVNAFDVDLGAPQTDTISKDKDFFLMHNVYQKAGDESYFIRGPARWWSGELFPPTFDIPVKNAFSVERIVPSFAHGKIAMLGIINTPWGSYDVDSETVELGIQDPNGQPVNPDKITRFADFSVAHGGHFKPVNITWIWDYQASKGLPAGNYTVTVSASNLQHSASAECEAWFTLERGRGDRLVAGESGEGLCGVQTASDEDLEEIKEGAESSAEE